MKGYDFDKTIYKGDSSVDFFFYMLFSKPYLLLFSLWFLILFALYGMHLMGKKKFKEMIFFFIPWQKNLERTVDKFWLHNANKIQDWYTLQKTDDDIIISASPLFIIKPAIDMLHIKNYIATNYSVKTGKIIGENCYGEVKLKEFKRIYPKQKLEAFYSDSMSDLPMFKFSQSAYLVTNGKVEQITV